MIDKQDTSTMKEEDDEKILDVIYKFYKLNTVSYNFNEWSNGIFLRTTKSNSIVTVSKLNYLGSFCLFESSHDIVEKILTWADTFEVYEDGKKVACIKNVFLGCKTLEEVLIMKELYSNEVGNL